MHALKQWLIWAWLAGLLTACGPRFPLQWKEEVQLADGRVVWVERTASVKGMGEIGGPPGISDEHYSLSFTPVGGASLPEWQGEYAPMIFDYDTVKNEWYIVSTFFNGCQTWFKLGRPEYPYVEYRIRNDAWKRVPVHEWLVGHKVNMYGEIDYKHGEKEPVTLQLKTKQEIVRWEKYYQQILSIEEQFREFDWTYRCAHEADMNPPGSHWIVEEDKDHAP